MAFGDFNSDQDTINKVNQHIFNYNNKHNLGMSDANSLQCLWSWEGFQIVGALHTKPISIITVNHSSLAQEDPEFIISIVDKLLTTDAVWVGSEYILRKGLLYKLPPLEYLSSTLTTVLAKNGIILKDGLEMVNNQEFIPTINIFRGYISVDFITFERENYIARPHRYITENFSDFKSILIELGVTIRNEDNKIVGGETFEGFIGVVMYCISTGGNGVWNNLKSKDRVVSKIRTHFIETMLKNYDQSNIVFGSDSELDRNVPYQILLKLFRWCLNDNQKYNAKFFRSESEIAGIEVFTSSQRHCIVFKDYTDDDIVFKLGSFRVADVFKILSVCNDMIGEIINKEME